MKHQYEDKGIQKYKIYMLHLEKLVKTGIVSSWVESKSRYCEKSFFCYGYYDKLTYIEEKDDSRFTYEHMFSIKYPYKQAEQSINADQLFTLLEPEEEAGQGQNPFMENKGDTPFLGVYLITFDILNKEKMEKTDGFYATVKKHRAQLNHMLDEICKNSDDITKTYYSPNCADLCIVLRTGSLEKIYQLKRSLRRYMANNDLDGKQSMGITLYIASEFAESDKQILGGEVLEKENKSHQIEIRMQCSPKVAVKFQKKLEDMGQTLFGVTGKGDYTFKLDYSFFSKIYPLYVGIKFGEYNEKAKNVYKLSDSLIEILRNCKFLYERWYLHVESAENPEEDCNSGKDLWIQKRTDICQAMHKAVEELRNHVDDVILCKENEEVESSVEFPRQRFMEQYRMVKDLLYTYENLWYDENNISEGRVFYAQMAVLLEGINQQIETICKAIQYSKKTSAVSREKLGQINDDLIRNMNDMIAGINNFNKLIQAVNQNLRNVPNYEMQSKVNVEKYLYAYTMYLMELCNKYYKRQGVDKKENERIFPMVTISMKGQKIEALSLFRNLEDSEDDKDVLSVFLVQCPNYQRFANAYHVLPMISHEISHCFRYEEREKRNRFILKIIAQGITEELMDELLGEGYQKYGQRVKSQYVEFIYNVIWKELENYLALSLKERLPYIHLINMDKVCMKVMWNCFGVSEPHKLSERKLWEICKNNFIKLFSHCHIEYVTPLIFGTNPEKHSEEYVADGLVNLLIDILFKDYERIDQWKNILEDKEICQSLEANPWFNVMQEIISSYRENHITVSDQAIENGLRVFANRVWKEFFVNEKNEIDERLDEDDFKCMGMISKRISKGEEQIPEIKLIETKMGMDEEMAFRLERYISETVTLIREIQQRWLVYGKNVCAPEKMYDEYIKEMHHKLHDQYNQKSSDLKNNHWIVTKKIQELYASLGIINNNPEQFVNRLQTAVANVDSRYLETILRDRMRLYAEVFADLGMCKIFNFSSFGYFAYAIHLFIKERELPQAPGYDMTEERMKMVIFTLWGGGADVQDNSIKLKEEIERYEYAIKEYQQRVKEEEKGNKELQMHKSMLTWMKAMYNEMCFESSAQTYEFILAYLKEMYTDTENMDFLKEGIDPIVQQIGSYYNKFIDSVGNEVIKNSIMDVQNEFVLRYYGKMQDACARVEDLEVDCKTDGISFVEQYNRQFMQW